MECDFEACEGFHYKFPSCLAAVLYERADDSDERCGHTDYGFAALFLVYEEWTVAAADWSGDGDFTVPAGTFALLMEETSGAVEVVLYDTDTDAQEAYDEWFGPYAIWEEANGY